MICSAERIEQPYSGQYVERIYDIKSPWNSREWTWIKFEDENGEWCGEFRGKYRGVSVSKKLGIVVVLTSDYMYTLDINTADLIEYDSQSDFVDITTSPNGDIFLTDGYSIEIVVKDNDEKIETTVVDYMPVNPDNLRFEEWNNNILKISCCEFYHWENELELYLDCETLEWIRNTSNEQQNRKESSKCYWIYISLSIICMILLFYNIIRTDSWTGDMPFSEFTNKEWILFWIFMIEEVILGVLMFIFALLGGKSMKKNEKQERYLNDLLLRGMVDIRKLAGVANAKKLPNGEFGFCLICLNGSTMNLYDTNFKQEVGELLYSVDLKKVTNLKTSSFVFNSYIKFTYEGFNYKLVDCAYKELYSAIENEAL